MSTEPRDAPSGIKGGGESRILDSVRLTSRQGLVEGLGLWVEGMASSSWGRRLMSPLGHVEDLGLGGKS